MRSRIANSKAQGISEIGVRIIVGKSKVIYSLGDGEKIISQYPSSGSTLNVGNKVFLVTNASEYKMPNIIGWSRGDVTSLAKLMKVSTTFTGFGYVTSTTVQEGTVISSGLNIEATLEAKYKTEEEEKKEKEEKEKEKSKKKR